MEPAFRSGRLIRQGRDPYLELGAEIKVGSGLYKEACDIFEDRLYRNVLKEVTDSFSD